MSLKQPIPRVSEPLPLGADNILLLPHPSGSPIRVNLGVLLPDGSRLTDSINQDKLQSIVLTLKLERERRKTYAFAPATATALTLLVHWMDLKGIYRFRDLRENDIVLFVTESSFGLDHLLRASERIVRAIRTIESDSSVDQKSLTIATIFHKAGISRSQIPKLHKATGVADAFVKQRISPTKED